MDNLIIKNGIEIPAHELEITASRSGGPGGQHVNKTSSRITVRWNVKNTLALNQAQKEHVMERLQSEITSEGDILVSNSTSRSQTQNKQLALDNLAQKIRQALYVPKKRMKVKVSKSAKEARLHEKKKRSSIKAMRSKRIHSE
jgi:ribosome-associated protein